MFCTSKVLKDDQRFAAILKRGATRNIVDEPTVVICEDATGAWTFAMTVLAASTLEHTHPEFATTGLLAWWKLTDGMLTLETHIEASTQTQVKDILVSLENPVWIRDSYIKAFANS